MLRNRGVIDLLAENNSALKDREQMQKGSDSKLSVRSFRHMWSIISTQPMFYMRVYERNDENS